ncbi:hypothetical protein COO60DRAFT_1499499 [Scenedesmus sp. NREL 46B-D3]|nr:hypothetical protein COO60DRAFT_1499499 [Scenedesmus sp. NREL 46B-D3]
MYGPQGFAAGSYGPQGAMSVSQGPTGQTVTYPDGTTVTQGPGVSSSVWAHNGGWRKGNRGAATIITQGAGGQRVQWGRRMLLARKDSRVLLSSVRRLQGVDQYGYWGNSNNNAVTSNDVATASNTGYARGGVFANSQSTARDTRSGNWWSNCSWCTSRVTSNSAAVATNSGVTDGPVVANSVSFADGRH